MYLNFFDLNKEPFQITPDPAFLFLSQGHKEALASIIYGVEKCKGFILIVGPVGVGKTTILRAYLEKNENERVKTIYLFNANVSYHNLLSYMLKMLDVVPESDDISEMVTQLHQILMKEYQRGHKILLLIDEAQNMPVDTLENLRMLSNFETATEKLIQIVFSAQPEFEKTLNLEELKQLKQRIAVKAVISPLSEQEGLTYIHHRLQMAAQKETAIFTERALKEIVRTAEGIPRVINVLCDNCLITAFGYGRKEVGVRVVKEITKDFGMKRPCWLRASLGLALVAVAVVAGLWTMKARYALPAKPVLSQNVDRTTTRQEALSAPVEGKAAVAQDQARHRVVERGDTLAKLIKEVYGRVNPSMIRMVRKANPTINDENVIIEGASLVFPPVRGK
jgi:general secretion pathway protein A